MPRDPLPPRPAARLPRRRFRLRPIRKARDIGLHDVGMLQQDLLDLERCNVDAADLDHLLRPAAKSDPPVLVGASSLLLKRIQTIHRDDKGSREWAILIR